MISRENLLNIICTESVENWSEIKEANMFVCCKCKEKLPDEEMAMGGEFMDLCEACWVKGDKIAEHEVLAIDCADPRGSHTIGQTMNQVVYDDDEW
jgi:hypothetical protein